MNKHKWRYFGGFVLLVLAQQAWANYVDSDSTFRKQTQGYLIAGVIKQWGEPNKVSGNWYIWRDCAQTGVIITAKDPASGTYRSYPETACCTQSFKVVDGVIEGYKSSGRGRCFNALNYQTVQSYGKAAVYGGVGLHIDKAGQLTIPWSVQADKQTVHEHLREDCAGRCDKVVEFHKTCLAMAHPQGKDKELGSYVSVTHKDANTATSQAKARCEKGGQACKMVVWDSKVGNTALCALP